MPGAYLLYPFQSSSLDSFISFVLPCHYLLHYYIVILYLVMISPFLFTSTFESPNLSFLAIYLIPIATKSWEMPRL